MTTPIGIGSSVIETVRVPARSGIVAEIFKDEKGNFHARVVTSHAIYLDGYFWSPIKQLSVKE